MRNSFKYWFGGILLMLFPISTVAQDIKIQVLNIDSSRPGNITVMLYKKDGYPKNHSKAISTQHKPADKKNLEFTFSIDFEEYAIKVLHDENMDGQVTKGWTGIFPAEGLGFSNNATLRFGPPSFKRSKLLLSETKNDIEILMLYP